MGKLTFTLELEFEDKITDDLEIAIVGANIARAIKSEVDHGEGIVPETSETFTKSISVKPQFTNEEIFVKVW